MNDQVQWSDVSFTLGGEPFPMSSGVYEYVGASHTTLVRRVGYGGRKGRSALRRLFERALPIFFTTNEGARLRGCAVSMSETDFAVRLHGQQ